MADQSEAKERRGIDNESLRLIISILQLIIGYITLIVTISQLL